MGPRGDPRGQEDVRVVMRVKCTLAGEVPFGATPVDENEQVEPTG